MATIRDGAGVWSGSRMGHAEFELLLRGYRLTTAEILYHLPDHPALLQTFLWQDLDIAPRFPVLVKFLSFWKKNLEGRVHSVRVAWKGIVAASEVEIAGSEITLH